MTCQTCWRQFYDTGRYCMTAIGTGSLLSRMNSCTVLFSPLTFITMLHNLWWMAFGKHWRASLNSYYVLYSPFHIIPNWHCFQAPLKMSKMSHFCLSAVVTVYRLTQLDSCLLPPLWNTPGISNQAIRTGVIFQAPFVITTTCVWSRGGTFLMLL